MYIRARAGGEVDGRRVARALGWACIAVLAVVTVVTTIGAARQDSTETRLQRHGISVTITVTGCEGVSSGVGQALIYDICRGSFELAGARYDEVIGGTRIVHPDGQVLAGVAVPGDPPILATAASVARRFSPWTPFVTPIVLAGVTVAAIAGMLALFRRRGSAR